jgi:diacylglycerol kinase (ATP)
MIIKSMEQKEFTTTGLLRIFNATGYSFKGIQRAWKTEAAVRQEFVLALIMLPIAFLIAQSLAQVVLLVLSLFIVVITELLNTSIEYAIDRIGSEKHDLSGASKDIASAAVFFSLAQVAFVWGITIIYNLGWIAFPLLKF